MKIRALKALVGDYGRLNEGDEIDLPKHIASQLLAYGYVELVTEPEPTVRRKGKKMVSASARKRRFASYLGAGVVVGIGAPSNSVLPAISGTAQVGQTLTSTTGTWSGSPTFTRQWNADGAAIVGATAATYVPVVGDVGKVITVTVTATNDRGSVSATSAPTAAVIAA